MDGIGPGGVKAGDEALDQRRGQGFLAVEMIERGALILGNAIALLVNMLDPQGVVVGGGLASLDGPYWRALGEAARRGIWHRPAKDVQISRSCLKGKAGMIGAALANGRP